MDPLIEAYLGVYGEAFNHKGEFVREGPAPASSHPKPENSSNSKKSKKPQMKKEELEYILDVLVSEGFAVDYDGAEFILEAMSDEWIDCILDEKYVKQMDTTGRGPDRRAVKLNPGGRPVRLRPMNPEVKYWEAEFNNKASRGSPSTRGRREQRRQSVGGFNA